ncbi:MAG: GcrA family cell cycle regulator [Gemmatimonadaceae bacterium]
MNTGRPDWPPERIAELRRLWDTGLTATQIGCRLGLSKNAVIGRAHRLHLPPRPSPLGRGGKRMSAQEIAEARRLRALGWTQRKIGAHLGWSLKAIKAHTSAPPKPPKPAKVAPPPKALKSAPSAPKPALPPLPLFVAPPPAPRPVIPPRSIAAAGTATFGSVRTCQWIDGDVRNSGWSFCAAEVVGGRSWCAGHLRRVFLAVRVEAQVEGAAA